MSIRISKVFLAAALAATMGLVPAASGAVTAATYSATGTLRVEKKTPQAPGTWSMTGSLRRMRGVGAGAPSSGTLSASGRIGLASVQGFFIPCVFTATTGAFVINWSNGKASKGTTVHLMTHPRHTLAGVFTAGYLKGATFTMTFKHNASGTHSGNLIVGPQPHL